MKLKIKKPNKLKRLKVFITSAVIVGLMAVSVVALPVLSVKAQEVDLLSAIKAMFEEVVGGLREEISSLRQEVQKQNQEITSLREKTAQVEQAARSGPSVGTDVSQEIAALRDEIKFLARGQKFDRGTVLSVNMGPSMIEIQDVLIYHGILTLADIGQYRGYLGPKTEAAARAFAVSKGLEDPAKALDFSFPKTQEIWFEAFKAAGKLPADLTLDQLRGGRGEDRLSYPDHPNQEDYTMPERQLPKDEPPQVLSNVKINLSVDKNWLMDQSGVIQWNVSDAPAGSYIVLQLPDDRKIKNNVLKGHEFFRPTFPGSFIVKLEVFSSEGKLLASLQETLNVARTDTEKNKLEILDKSDKFLACLVEKGARKDLADYMVKSMGLEHQKEMELFGSKVRDCYQYPMESGSSYGQWNPDANKQQACFIEKLGAEEAKTAWHKMYGPASTESEQRAMSDAMMKCEDINPYRHSQTGPIGISGPQGGGGGQMGCYYNISAKTTGEQKTLFCESPNINCRYDSPAGTSLSNSELGDLTNNVGTGYNCQGGGSAGGGGGSTTGSMQKCFYPNASRNGQSLGYSVWCQSDYVDCHKESPSGESIPLDGLALGGPSSCESGYSGGGGGSTGSVSCSWAYPDKNSCVAAGCAWYGGSDAYSGDGKSHKDGGSHCDDTAHGTVSQTPVNTGLLASVLTGFTSLLQGLLSVLSETVGR